MSTITLKCVNVGQVYYWTLYYAYGIPDPVWGSYYEAELYKGASLVPPDIIVLDHGTINNLYYQYGVGLSRFVIRGSKADSEGVFRPVKYTSPEFVPTPNSVIIWDLAQGTIMPEPIPDFSFQQISPLVIAFTNLSKNATSYDWDFGDGATDDLNEHPTHLYTAPGIYLVKLAAISDWGIRLINKQVSVTGAGSGLIPNFTSNVIAGPVPLAVQFTDTSIGNPTAWDWDFGDGNYSLVRNPYNVYTAPGVYTVSLSVSKSGITETVSKAGYIEATAGPPPPIPPTAGGLGILLLIALAASQKGK